MLPALVDLWYSLAGSAVWVVIFAVWLSVYLTQRVYWDEVGDRLTLVVPKGA